MYKKRILIRLCFISIGAGLLLGLSALGSFSSRMDSSNIAGSGQIIAGAILIIGGLHGLISVEKSDFPE